MKIISRRRLLAGTGVALGAAALDAFAVEPSWLDVTTHDVPVARLPRGLDGFTIAQVTDAHLRSLGRVEEAIVRELHAREVQLLVLTGDIIDSSEHLHLLRQFCARVARRGMAVVATLGNWEHWGRIAEPALAAAYAESGVKLLVNEGLALSDGVDVFATDDATAGQPKLVGLGEGRGDASILLTHSPRFLDGPSLQSHKVSLALAGHTHGGQVRLGSRMVPFVPAGSGRFLAGWYDVPAGKAYVSRGIGTSIAPIRFTCRPELPIFRLRQG